MFEPQDYFDAEPGFDDDRDSRDDVAFDTVPESGDPVHTNGIFLSEVDDADGRDSDEEEPDEEECLSDQNEDGDIVHSTEGANHDVIVAGSAMEAQLEVRKNVTLYIKQLCNTFA